jgi:hypothetical protein
MDIYVHIVMREALPARRGFSAHLNPSVGFTTLGLFPAYIYRPLDDMGVHVADAAMAGAIHHGRSGLGAAARSGAAVRAEQRQSEQQYRQADGKA